MNKLKTVLMILVAVVVFSSCETEEGAPASQPWTEDFTFGNFTVNSVNVLTSQDGYSSTYQADNVLTANLPATDFGILTIQIYVPTDEGFTTSLSNISAAITLESGSGTSNLYSSEYSGFLQQVTLGDQLYSVYEIYAVYPAGGTVITRDNFANIVFSMSASYEKNDKQVGTRFIGVEVFKAD